MTIDVLRFVVDEPLDLVAAGQRSTQRYDRIVRLVLTPRCELRCLYCHNEGFSREDADFDRMPGPVLGRTLERLRRLGIGSIALTGGEPTESRRFEEVVSIAADVVGGSMVHVTTNGVLLGRHLPHLRAAGIDRINVSCAAVDPVTLRRITGHDVFDGVVTAIDRAVDCGFTVNVNHVALAGLNTSTEYLRRTLEFWSERGVRLSFLRLAAGNGVGGVYYPLRQLSTLMESWGMQAEVVHNHNRPSTLRYRYREMDVYVRDFVPDRSIHPCSTCQDRDRCSEGLDYLRLGMNALLRGCLLRDDFQFDLLDARVSDAELIRLFRILEQVPATNVAAGA